MSERERTKGDRERRAAVVSLVTKDVEIGLGNVFPAADDGGFALTEPFGDSDPINNDAVEVIVWTWSGVDTEGFQQLQPTNAEVVVRGVTLVEHPERGDEATFHRYVDWSEVAGQLGLGFTGRPTVDELPGRPRASAD